MAKKAKNKRGRPSAFTQETADEICSLLASGMSLISICDRPGKPSTSMVMRWLSDNEGFREQYARSRSNGHDRIALEALKIADDTTEDPQSRRVRVDTRKWFLSKLAPKKYGDKIEVEQTGEQRVRIIIGGNPSHDEKRDRD